MKILLIFFCLLGTSFAIPIESPLLWKATKDDKVAYIFGKSNYFSLSDLPNDFKRKYLSPSAHVLVQGYLESNSDEFQNGQTLPDGKTLAQELTPESWGKIEELFTYNHRFLNNFQYSRPWVVWMSILNLVNHSMGLNVPTRGTIEEYGAKRGVLHYLEGPVNYMVAIYDQIYTIPSLEDYLQGAEDARTIFNRVGERATEDINCYTRGDVSCLTFLVNTNYSSMSEGGYKIFLDVEIRQRNRHYVPVIEKFLEEGGQVFVAVGYYHLLVMEGDLLSLLMERGFIVQKVY